METGLAHYGQLTVLTIDGPAGTGKTTVAKQVAARLGLWPLDTGAIYRAIALACVLNGVNLDDEIACMQVLTASSIQVTDKGIILDGALIPDRLLRAYPAVASGSSQVAAHSAIRHRLVDLQRDFAKRGVVAEGRDMGTTIFPDARVKIFLTAADDVRRQRIASTHGKAVAKGTKERDERDANRLVAPTRAAPDAHMIDTGKHSQEDVVMLVVELARKAGF